MVTQAYMCHPSIREVETDPWGSLARQSWLLNEFQAFH